MKKKDDRDGRLWSPWDLTRRDPTIDECIDSVVVEKVVYLVVLMLVVEWGRVVCSGIPVYCVSSLGVYILLLCNVVFFWIAVD